MESGRRARLWTAIGAAAAGLGALLAAPGEAAADTGETALFAGTAVALLGTDVTFAVHGLAAAANQNMLPRDGWLWAQAIAIAPQALFFNGLLVGMNASKDDDLALVASGLGLIPTSCVTALTTHAIWGLADDKVPADALAGISVLIGIDTSLSMAAIGRATRGRVHARGIGVMAMVMSAPAIGVSAYESSFQRPQQGAWIGLTAWSSALFVHGLVSAIIDGRLRDDPPVQTPLQPPEIPPQPGAPPSPTLQKAARGPFSPATFSVAPTVLSNGVSRVPGLMATGTF